MTSTIPSEFRPFRIPLPRRKTRPGLYRAVEITPCYLAGKEIFQGCDAFRLFEKLDEINPDNRNARRKRIHYRLAGIFADGSAEPFGQTKGRDHTLDVIERLFGLDVAPFRL